jgi:hypothetical protein
MGTRISAVWPSVATRHRCAGNVAASCLRHSGVTQATSGRVIFGAADGTVQSMR